MARANDLLTAIKTTYSEDEQLKMMGELVMIALPMPTVKALSDAAAKRNLTLAQVLSLSINDFLRKTESKDVPPNPRYLTEG